MLRIITAAMLLGLSLAACNTGAPNRLSALETADLRFTSLEIRTPDTARISWSEVEDQFRRSRGLGALVPLGAAASEARAFVQDRVALRMKAVLDRVIAKRAAGSRPVRAVVTIVEVYVPSPLFRVVVGGHPGLSAEIDILDARTNAVLTTYKGNSAGQVAGQGPGGVLLDAVLTEAGLSDVFDRSAEGFAKGFERWLAAS